MLSVSPTNSESTTFDVKGSRPIEPDANVKPIALSASFRFLNTFISPRPQMPPFRFLYDVKSSMTDSSDRLVASAGFSRAMCELPVTPNVPSGLMFRSNIRPSKFEWATLPLNTPCGMRRGHTFAASSVPSNAPMGCSGSEYQKPFASEPAATFSTKWLNGFVIQYVVTVLSDGIRTSAERWPLPSPLSPGTPRLVGLHGFVGWHFVAIPRLRTNQLPVSMPSSRKKQCPTLL